MNRRHTAGATDRPQLVVATRSAHKLRELQELLHPARADLVTLDELGIEGEAIEDGRTFEANARKKARWAVATSGLPSLADDSGLEVEALGGRPGVHTRRYAGPSATDDENNAKLLDELAGLSAERRGARYVCVLALALPDEWDAHRVGRMIVRRGTTRGRIAAAARGTGGFGYDPIFEPAGEPPGGRTLGEWTAAAKHRISHRGRAARRMAHVLADIGF
jgi:XTP/dITP diphosphohydrolase